MKIGQAVFLAVVQGLTEFLPVSSSGHLALVQNLFGWPVPVSFDVLVHLGTVLAVVWYFRKRLVQLWQTRDQEETRRYLGLILLGCLPAVVMGFFLEPRLEVLFGSLKLVGVGLVLTGTLLMVVREREKVQPLNGWRSLLVGFFQSLALMPGISRSGSTIGSGLLVGLDRQKAFEFSFFLAIPVTFGAVGLQVADFFQTQAEFGVGLVGLAVSALVGFLALGWLEKVLQTKKINRFGVYCLGMGLLLLVW
ncbi:undecaprenyl-diphosphate phosphatase [Patescibacteria group bacterium]|nr:undecaprenyl-diphosphate phosphatase [Patescibacteria group bacterium]